MTSLVPSPIGRPRVRWAVAVVLGLSLAACSMGSFGGFGGGLNLNVTGVQSRVLAIEIAAGDADARIVRLDAGQEIELGQGTVTIDRYLIQQVTFGDRLATGLFLCEAPCENPVGAFIVAYSPDRLFESDGELQLRFRVVQPDDSSQEVSQNVGPQMLPSLWREPAIQITAEGP